MAIASSKEGAHDSVFNVISLTAGQLRTFTEIWYSVFLWALFSSLFVHVGASLIGFCQLRKHKQARWFSVAILAMGVLSPLTGGVVSSAAVAGVYRASDFIMMPFYALVWG